MPRRLAHVAALALGAAAGALAAGWGAAGLVERSVGERISRQAQAAGLDWLRVEVDGARVMLSGFAPDDAAAAAAREAATSAARYATVIDGIETPPPPPPAPPEPIALEILVDPEGVTLAGLAPDDASLSRLSHRLGAAAPSLARIAGADVEPVWRALEDAAVEASGLLSHGRVALALAPAAVAVAGLPRDPAARAALESLAAKAKGVQVVLALETPPEPAPAAPAASAAEASAAEAEPPIAPPADAGAVWLRVTVAPELVTITGAAPDSATRAAVVSYAVAALGADRLHDGLALAAGSGADGWRAAALAALDALGGLDTGEAVVAGGRIDVVGSTMRPAAAREAHAALAPERTAGWAGSTRILVDLPKLSSVGRLPPGRCAEELTAIAAADPIRFAPSSADIDAASGSVLDALAAALARCEGGMIEVGGHTDSQGSEGYNQRLSQERALAVRSALEARGAPPGVLGARGYGESAPIADNAEEAGRALNRRIAFTPIDPEGEGGP